MREFWRDFRQYVTPVNTVIVILTIAMYVVQRTVDIRTYGAFSDALQLEWWTVLEHKEYYRVITCCFLHGSAEHIFNNMLVLLFLGSTVERLVGPVKYLISYLGCGIVSSFASVMYSSMNYSGFETDLIPSIGASGAIFGISGMLLGIAIMCRGQVRGMSLQRILIFLALSIYSGIRDIGIDNAAHIGGAVFGVITAFIMFRAEEYDEG